jgi:DNA-3-methyladenine glycosylase
VFPVEGVRLIAPRRQGVPRSAWTDGPAKLCQALAINGAFNGLDLCQPHSPIFVEAGIPIPDQSVTTGPRVGLNSVPEPWKSIPWRFRVRQLPVLLRAACARI